MTSSYNANIVVNVQNQRSLDRVAASIGRVNSLIKQLKPINLLAPGAGAGADQIKVAMAEIGKKAKAIQGDVTKLSATFAGVSGQARAFSEVLANVKIEPLKKGKTLLESQKAEVRAIAEAFAMAEKKAGVLEARYTELLDSARQAQGLAIGPATQLGTLEADLQKRAYYENEIKKEKDKQNRLDREAIKNQKKLAREAKKRAKEEEKFGGRRANILQGAILGGGFPLLFGGPSFSAVGGLIGGGIGGGIGPSGKFAFAGGIGGSVIGGIFDSVAAAALELGKALENPTKNLNALAEALPISGTKTKGLINQLQDLGLESVAASLALSVLDDELEALGLSDEEIKKFSEQTTEFNNAFKALKIAASALASQGLINFMTLLTKLANVFRENKDSFVQGIRAVGGLIIGDDRALGEMAGMGPSVSIPTGPLAAKPSPVKESQTQEEIAAQAIVANIQMRQVKLATDAATIEQHKLKLIRGRLAEANAIVAIDRAKLNLIKAQLNFDTETNATVKETLRVKRDIAQAEVSQALAARENARILRQQQDAAHELERRTVGQAEAMKDLTASIAAQQTIRATSPFENEEFLMDPFFGGSRKLESEQNTKFAETLRTMNAELENVNKNIELGTNLDDKAKQALLDKRLELKNNIARYKEYQPAIDEAALAQARFNEALAITSPITDSLLTGLQNVVAGTQTAEEAFANFLRSVADMLMDVAKQMIAQYIAIGIARLFAGMGSFESGNTKVGEMANMGSIGMGGTGIVENKMGQGFGTLGPNFGIRQYAQGGYVNGPTRALVGEGGESEYIIPESKMRESMSRYSRGARGSSVIPDGGASGTSSESGGTAVAAPIDVRYTVERINSVDYVTADQFQAGLRQAADQGAKQGEQKTLKRLQMSSGTRKRLGM